MTVAKTRSLQRPANILLSSLALSDLLVGAVAQPALIARSLFQNIGDCCLYDKVGKMWYPVIPLLALNSFVQICVMSWDRFKAVSSPMIYRSTATNKKTLAVTVMAWLSWVIARSFIARLSNLLKSLCVASLLMTIAVTHVATIRAIRRRKSEIVDINASEERTAFAREKKMAVTLRWILAITVLSICPQILIGLLIGIRGAASLAPLQPWGMLLMCLNSSLSPIVYFWRHKNMRSAALRMLSCTE